MAFAVEPVTERLNWRRSLRTSPEVGDLSGGGVEFEGGPPTEGRAK